MTHKDAAGERFIINATEMWLIEITTFLNKAGYKKRHFAKCQTGWSSCSEYFMRQPSRMQLLDSERFTPADKAQAVLVFRHVTFQPQF